MKDRAMQALYKLALAPAAETTAGGNSYGFREGRSCADAIQAAFNALNKPNSATWVFEADIVGCFDNISKTWLLDNIPMDKTVLRKWLEAGYVENGINYPTRKGTPQGGIISPTLSNMTLDGLEEAVRRAVLRRNRVNFVRYAMTLLSPTNQNGRWMRKSSRSLKRSWLNAVFRYPRKHRGHVYQKRIYVPRANISTAWPDTAHHDCQRGSPRPYTKCGNDNQEARRRADVCPDQEAQRNASGLG